MYMELGKPLASNVNFGGRSVRRSKWRKGRRMLKKEMTCCNDRYNKAMPASGRKVSPLQQAGHSIVVWLISVYGHFIKVTYRTECVANTCTYNRRSNAEKWHQWRKAIRGVSRKQLEIVEATRRNDGKMFIDYKKDWSDHLQVEQFAVLNVSRASGSKTPWIGPQEAYFGKWKWDAIGDLKKIVESPSTYSTAGVKRVWIPKGTARNGL
jgi:hypothetical protein